jgi:hypothetical protein
MDPKKFVEVRLWVAEADGKSADLSLVNADLTLAPRDGKPIKRAFQLMMPDPPQGMPKTEAQTLPDGHQIHVGVAEFDRPFDLDKPASGKPAVYFKADVPAELAKEGTAATVHFTFPSGKQQAEIKSLFRK